jgi:hypothetical protein
MAYDPSVRFASIAFNTVLCKNTICNFVKGQGKYWVRGSNEVKATMLSPMSSSVPWKTSLDEARMVLISFKRAECHLASDKGGGDTPSFILADVVPKGIPLRAGSQELELRTQVREGVCASTQAICFRNGLSNSSSALGLLS